jgi:hypothetical protein
MRRWLACSWLLIATCGLVAAPVRPLYEAPEPPTPHTIGSLAGTYWFGKCYTDNFWIIFEEQGTINWGYGSLDAKKAGSTGTWRLQGNEVYFEFNKKTLEFRGTTDGQTIKGMTFNDSGARYPTYLKITPRPK